MKKVLLLISLLMLFFTIYLTVDTYALFESNKKYNVNTDIAKWVIKVNESDVSLENEFVVDTLVINANDSVVLNKIAPGGSGYFDIEIDAYDTDVSVRYDMTFDFSSLTSPGLVVSSISELGGNSLVLTDLDTYSGVIDYSNMDDVTSNTIRVTITWDDDSVNDENDTLIGSVYNNAIEIPVYVKLTQYLGEELTLYDSE